MTDLVFVYGTLRENEANHHFMDGAACIARQAWTNGKLFATGKGYPVLQKDNAKVVYGELYRVNGEQLAKIDELEGYVQGAADNLFDRNMQIVETDQGTYQAYVYTISFVTSAIKQESIMSGDWKVYRLLQKDSFYYFAYGSCMDGNRFKLQKADHHFLNVVGRGVLEGHTLRFRIHAHDGGRADIVEEGGFTQGKVYAVTSDVLSYLYKREGVHSGHYRPAVVPVTLDDGKLVEALTFIVVNKDEEAAPPAHYMEEILRGGKGCCSTDYLKALEERYELLRKVEE